MLDALLPQLQGFEILDQRQSHPRQAFLRVPKAQIFSLLGLLKQTLGFATLTTVNCTDWIEDGVFRLTYVLETPERDRVLCAQTDIGRDGDALETCIPLWPQAEIFERELHEMFGIPILGHPSLVDFMLEAWTHTPPMRREFDTLKFVQETYEMRSGREDNQDVREAIRRRKEAKATAKPEPKPKPGPKAKPADEAGETS